MEHTGTVRGRAQPLGMLGARLRDGSWLTPARLLAYPRLVGLVLATAVTVLLVASRGGIDPWGRPLGTDFEGVWVAGAAVLAGHPALPYDNAANAAAQAAAFGPSDSFLPWPYPPAVLLVAGALALLPYLAALALWQGGTLALYLAAMRRVLAGPSVSRGDLLVGALAYPAVAINLLQGQNGFLSAGLIGLGTMLVARRPVVAGALLGLLAYKPQVALAVPVALAAGRHWRALGAATAAIAATIGVTLLALGVEPWWGFLHNLGFARRVILEMGGLESYKLQSAFAAARLIGAPLVVAYAVQAGVSVAALSAVAWVWSGTRDVHLKLAGLASASLLATPYAVDYDLVILGPALAALVAVFQRQGFPPYAKSLLAAVWIMPLAARTTARVTAVPVGFLATAALLWLVVVAARRDRKLTAEQV